MISIITSVHNQLGMNKLFLENLREKTKLPFELIVVDNNSTDGSREYFTANADKIITNNANYSYPHCQNQGIAVAQFNHLAFFNNDIIVTRNWDTRILKLMEDNQIEVASFATNDHLESKEAHKIMSRRWKRSKNPIHKTLGTGYPMLKLMLWLMYRDLDKFGEQRFEKFGYNTIEGYSGSCIIMKKNVLDKIGHWDNRILGSDFDLFNRVKVRSIEKGDIKPIQLAMGIYIHHFQRLTLRSNREPFADQDNFITLEEKWGDRTATLRSDIIG
ncbi:MAG: glycosyltransferase [Bacteroidia bacterium]